MRRFIVCALAVATLFSAGVARADDKDAKDKKEEKEEEEEVPRDLGRLFLDSGRPEPLAPEEDTYRLFLHGEYQMRFQAERSFPLVASASAMASKPGITDQSLGQTWFVHHWLRLSPLPSPLKRAVLQTAKATGMAGLNVQLNVGNLLTVARKV